jgi:hypothetical protein
MKRILLRVAAVLVIAWFSFLIFVGWAMRQPPEKFGHIMAKMPVPAYFLFPFETMWKSARKGVLHQGDRAPDFPLETLDTKQPVSLASTWRERPVVLVFGSYT